MKKWTLFFHAALVCIALVSCSTMVCTSPALKTSKAGNTAAPGPFSGEVESLLPLSPASVYFWKDQQFVLLEKGTGFSEYGYQLYSCPRLDSCRENVDTVKWTKSHRAKSSVFLRHNLIVISIEPRGKEWLLVFRDKQTGDTLYATTTNGIYHEIVRARDLDGAIRRWKGKVVFSARGFINTMEGGKIGTIKVRLQDPLQVQDICFGVTPIPVKPIRLMVLTPFGKKGFIPVYYSWTNVNQELILGENPWDEDIFEVNPQKTFVANAETWRIINDHRIYTGMTSDQVRLSWGLPQRRSTAMFKGKQCENWIYTAQSLYFDEKKLIGSSSGMKLQEKPSH
jgi:hypothetical protein